MLSLTKIVWKLMENLHLCTFVNKRNSKTDMKVTVFKRKGTKETVVIDLAHVGPASLQALHTSN